MLETARELQRDGIDYDALYREQQRNHSRETLAFQMLATGLTEVKCGTARRVRAVHYLLALETVLSEALGECGRDQYDKVIDRYLTTRFKHAGGPA
jgi:hypothetical protein